MAEVAGATTILVRRSTRERLKRLGAKGETYEAIISRLVAMAEARGAEWSPPGLRLPRGPSPRLGTRAGLEEWTVLD